MMHGTMKLKCKFNIMECMIDCVIFYTEHGDGGGGGDYGSSRILSF